MAALAVRFPSIVEPGPQASADEHSPLMVTRYGRRKGEKWRIIDESIFVEMAAAMKLGESRSAAAAKFAPNAWGGGTVDSKSKRLREAYLLWAETQSRLAP